MIVKIQIARYLLRNTDEKFLAVHGTTNIRRQPYESNMINPVSLSTLGKGETAGSM
jgi:hypothetical protein